MSVTRGKFLKELGKSLPGMVLGGGVAAAAHKILGKVAAASEVGGVAQPVPAQNLPDSPDKWSTEFIESGPTMGNRIALTFDDGPTPGVTERVLDELKRRGLLATFFMIGERVAAAPELARRVLSEGHEIGNHTYTHRKLTTLPEKQVEEEIETTQEVILEVLGQSPRWFRPPFGALRRNQTDAVARRGMRVVLWSVDPKDWSEPGVEEISRAVLTDAVAGSIVLFHDANGQTADALGPILDGLLSRGFSPVTIGALLEENGAVGLNERTKSSA